MSATEKIREFAFKNDTGLTIPPYACMGIASTTDEANEITYNVRIPSYADEQSQDPAIMLFNMGEYVSNGSWGRCTSTPPCQALCDATYAGQIVGPVENQWVLGETGNAFVAKALDSTNPHSESGTPVWIVEPNIVEVEVVLVTSNTRDSDGYYPGVVQRFDVFTKAWSTLRSCRVRDVNQ